MHPYQEAIEFLLGHVIKTGDVPAHLRASELLQKCVAIRSIPDQSPSAEPPAVHPETPGDQPLTHVSDKPE